MNTIEYEIRPHNDQWHLLRDGSIACISPYRDAVIDVVACFHRSEIRQESFSHLKLTGFTLHELRNSRVLDINWHRKGPPIELARFEDAEYYLGNCAASPDASRAYLRFQHAMNDDRFATALNQLILLGDLLDCPSQYWHTLRLIAGFVWPTPHHIPNRKERGQCQTKIDFIERRAMGDRLWQPKLAMDEPGEDS